MSGRIRETSRHVSWVAECDCTGAWVALATVEGAEPGYQEWSLVQAVGGHSLTCRRCDTTYVLGGRLEGHGLPDLVEAGELGQIARLELTPLQRRLLDVSLIAEEALWCAAMDRVRAAVATSDHERAVGHWEAGRILRGARQRERVATLWAILREHGLDALTQDEGDRLRIARTSDGHGAVYAVDRGPLPVAARVHQAEPERFAVLDLTDSAPQSVGAHQ